MLTGRSLQRTWRVEGPAYAVDVRLEGERLIGTLEGPDGTLALEARAHRTGPEAVVVRFRGRAHRAVVVREGACLWVAMDGHTYQLCVEAPGRPQAPPSTETQATSPMTGRVVTMQVAPGQAVAEGETLCVVEAMKMEYAVRAPRDVTVAEVRAQVGDQVQVNQSLVLFAEEERAGDDA